MRFEDALKCMREWKEVKYRNDVYYIDKKGRLIVRYSDVDMKFVPSFTAEQIMSEEWEINMLKNKKKINISEGNVKENDINVANNVAQRNSQDDELMKKIFPHKEVINGKIVSVFPYIEEVYPLKDVPQEVVSKMETTTLTEQYKTRTLQNNFYYFDNGKTQYIVEYHNIKGFEGLDGVKVLECVPSYEKWKSLNELLDSSLETNKALAHRLNICKELLKECREYVVNTPVYPQGDDNKQVEIHRLVDKINEALK